jgi:hypothetical protein
MEDKMCYAKIFDYKDYYKIKDNIPSYDSDEVFQIALEIACEKGRTVVVEDNGTGGFYRITPKGHVLPVPSEWGEHDWKLGDY